MGLYEIYYLQTNIVCIFILAFVFIAYTRNNFNDSKSKFFIFELILIAIYCLSDMFAAIFKGCSFNGVRVLLYMSNSVYNSLPILMALVWDLYISKRFITSNSKTNMVKKVLYVIFILVFFVSLFSCFTHFSFTLDANNHYQRSYGIYVVPVMCFLLLIYDFVRLLFITKKTDSIDYLTGAKSLMLFSVPIVLFSIVQIICYGCTLNSTGFTLGLLIVYMFDQANKISKDELTGINNRREFERQFDYISKNSNSMLIGMIDIDFFKEINDKYGHQVGDDVLKSVASLLTKACSESEKYGKFMIDRYGGDEFVILSREYDKSAASILRKSISNKIDDLNNSKMFDFKINVSIGFAHGSIAGKNDAKEMLYKADVNLYKYKSVNHSKKNKNK